MSATGAWRVIILPRAEKELAQAPPIYVRVFAQQLIGCANGPMCGTLGNCKVSVASGDCMLASGAFDLRLTMKPVSL